MVRTPEPPIPFQPIPGVVKVTFTGTNSATRWANVMHVQSSTILPLNQATVDVLATSFHTAYGTRFEALKCNSDHLLQTEVTDLGSDVGNTGVANTSVPGGHAPSPNPASVSLVVGWHITRRYRGGKPRTYFSGTPQSEVVNTQFWSPTYASSWEDAADSFITDIQGIVIPTFLAPSLCAVHRVRNHTVLTPPQVSTILTEHVDLRICGQSRRLGKVLAPQAE